MNKKGDEKVMGLWWFFVIIIITLGIVGGVIIYYGADVDVRAIESRMLLDRSYDCVIENGFLKREFFSSFDFYEDCDMEINQFNEGSEFFVKIRIENMSGRLIEERKYGQMSYEEDCEIVEEVSADKLAVCMTRSFVVSAEKGEKNRVIITGASNQKGRKVGF